MGKPILRAHVFDNLVERAAKPGATRLRGVVIVDARYPGPLVLATNLDVSVSA